MNGTVLKIAGLAASVIGAVASVVGGIVSGQQMKLEVAEQVAKAVQNVTNK